MENKNHSVVVLGASSKPERYSNMAVKMLLENNYHVIPVNPSLKEVENLPVIKDLSLIKEKVHTLTIYVGPARSKTMIEDILSINPGRVIFNPGTESSELEKQLSDKNIPFQKACTLVLLRTGQF